MNTNTLSKYCCNLDKHSNYTPSTKEDIKTLFNNLTPDQLENKLKQCNYDLDATLLNLLSSLEIAEINPTTPIYDGHKNPDNTKVCRFFLAGTCYRKDCWFKHDTSSTVCQYFQNGFCAYGDECKFIHKKVDEIASNLITPKTINIEDKIEKPNTDDFPSISKNKSTAFYTWNTNKLDEVKNVNNAPFNISKVDRIHSILPWVSKSIINSYLSAASYNEKSILDMLLKRFPKPANFKLETKKKENNTTNNSFNVNKIKKKPTRLPWIETGYKLDLVYKNYRKEAIEHAKLRNQFLELAKNAYLQGNSVKAKKLSVKGQYHNKMMHDKHISASERIFNSRNKDTSELVDSNQIVVVDLHCLHVDEAVVILKRRVNILKKEKCRQFYLLTGTGHHSYYSAPKILPNVVAYLNNISNLVDYWDCSVDGKGGVLLVEFI